MIIYTELLIRMKKGTLLFITVLISLLCRSQDFSLYKKRFMVQGNDTLYYRVLYPKDYDSTKKYPVLFFLHGAGERGNDNEKQLIHGAKLFLREDVSDKYKAIVIFPQCSRNDYWSNVLRDHEDKSRNFYFLEDGPPNRYMVLAQELVTLVLNTYPVKKDQVYVGGLSMGGMGTFEIVKRMPGIFAAAFPICGGANPATAVKMKNVRWWIFHGAKDDVVPPFHSEKMVTALKTAGAKVKFTLYPNANHNSWDSALAEPGLLEWLFGQRLKK